MSGCEIGKAGRPAAAGALPPRGVTGLPTSFVRIMLRPATSFCVSPPLPVPTRNWPTRSRSAAGLGSKFLAAGGHLLASGGRSAPSPGTRPGSPSTTSSALAACCTVAVAISAIFAAVSSAALMICFSDSPVCALSCAPSSTRCVDSLISEEISRAAWFERSASFRTSSATTAKPMPCSPARAASMAAFRASRFVWLAISEITWMISLICCELVRICSIDSIDFCTALPPSSASWLAFVGHFRRTRWRFP